MDDSDNTDERLAELAALEAIFPEIDIHDGSSDAVSFSLNLPVHPFNPVTVTFSVSSTTTAYVDGEAPGAVNSHEVVYLPPVNLLISLPKGYPNKQPPSVTISTKPPWLPSETIKRLEEEAPRMWEEIGRDMVLYSYVDHLQQAADDVFGLVCDSGTLQLDLRHRLLILDHDNQAKREAFERETFDCGVCLGRVAFHTRLCLEHSMSCILLLTRPLKEPKKGEVCHKMLDCGHVFCTPCLQDFYKTAITEGDLATVRCLAPNCAKDREAAQAASGTGKRRKFRAFISPSELVQMGLDLETVSRFVRLMYKTQLETDKNTIYCPRSWCDGAARSKKHRKPKGLELVEVSDDEDDEVQDEEDEEDEERQKKKRKGKKTEKPDDRLAICEDCGFAFCSRCLQTWHGEFFACSAKRDTQEITAEEQASIDYLSRHATSCPTCATLVQKTQGCNHMICFRCRTHFCYLCGSWLHPGDPFTHYKEEDTPCHMRLWDLVDGDGDRAEAVFPAVQPQRNPRDRRIRPRGQQDVANAVPEAVAEADEPGDAGDDEPGQQAEVAVALEAPLVLRIGAQPAPRGREAAGRGHQRQDQRGRGANPRPAAPATPAIGRAAPVGRRGGPGRGNGRGGERIAVRLRGRREDELHPADAAWVRGFVELALNDEEDSGVSDDEILIMPHHLY